MTLPRYPEYRSHKTPWLGSLPAHWDGQALKRVVAKIESGVSVNAVDEPVAGASIGVLKTSCVYTGRFDPTENKAVVADELDRVACPVKAQTLIVSRMNTPALVGAAGLVAADAGNLFLPDRLWQVHFAGALPVFVHYWTASPAYRAQVEMACAGTSSSMQNLSQDEFLRFALPLPPVSEQAAIATFLDHETAKIDGLIAEQERLIALLAEKRQATISHAVTRGLNPQAPMKDSGVPWLGEVPAHWKLAPIKAFGWLKGGAGFPHEDQGIEGEELNFFKVASLGMANASGVLQAGEHTISRQTAARLGAFIFPARTLVFAKVGAALMLARVRELAGDACIDNNMMGLVVNEGSHPGFVRHAMALVRFDLIANPGAVPSLNEGQIGGYVICQPPLQEQVQITRWLDAELARQTALTEEASLAIDLLRERRSALIAAAVTGQIDVRGFTAA